MRYIVNINIHFLVEKSTRKVVESWKASVMNKQFLLVHLLDKWKKQIINEHFVSFFNI